MKFDERPYLVFRREAGQFDDYTAEPMTPGFNIFPLVYSGDNRVKVFGISGHELEEDFGLEKVTIMKVTGKYILGDVPYKYVNVTGPQVTKLFEDISKILEEAKTDLLSGSSSVEFVKSQDTLWDLN